jgi:hypothetical protein
MPYSRIRSQPMIQGQQFPENGIGVGIRAPRLGQHGSQLRVTQSRQGAGRAGHQKGEDDAGSGDLHSHPGDDKDAGPDDLGHADDQQIHPAQGAAQGYACPGSLPRDHGFLGEETTAEGAPGGIRWAQNSTTSAIILRLPPPRVGGLNTPVMVRG